MKFCVQCGNPLTGGAAFCTSCGARVAPQHSPSDDAPTQMARPASDAGVRLPGAGTRHDGAPADAEASDAGRDGSLGATAYPAPPVQDEPASDAARTFSSTSPQAPQGLGAQYDWNQSSTAEPATTKEGSEPAHPASDETQQLPTNQQPLGQQFSGQTHPSVPQGHEASSQQYSHDPYTSAQPGQPYTPAQPYTSNQPYAGQQYAQPSYDSTQQMPQQHADQRYTGQQYTSAQPSPPYASAQPGNAQQGQAAAPYASSVPQQGGQPFAVQPAGTQNGDTQQGFAPAARPAVDWKALTPGLLRLLAAVTLALTALGNWWTSGDNTSRDQVGTTHSVLALIGCIGVVLACVAQFAVLPQFLGATMQPIVRFAVRAALCVPALIAVIIALATTLNGYDSPRGSYIGVTMLAMAVGFALAGLDDARDAVPTDVLRWSAVACAGLGIVLSILSLIQSFNADALNAKDKWLGTVPSFLTMSALAALVIWIAVTRPHFGRGLLVALSGSIAFAIITRGWIAGDDGMRYMTQLRQGHGAALIALALALATAAEVSSHGTDTATDDGSVARRMTQWVVPGFAVAAVAALVNAAVLMSVDNRPSGMTWYLVLMIIAALLYGACAFLLKTNPMGRLIAVVSAVTIALAILITIAASKSSGTVSEAFTEGAYLWLPLVAAAALTIPPAVRRVAGPIAPQARAAAPQQGEQTGQPQQFAQPGQQQFASAPQGQQFDSQAPQQWNAQQGQGYGQNG